MRALVALVALVLLVAACKRRSPATPAPSAPPVSQPAPEPAAKPAVLPVPAAGGSPRILEGDQNLPALNAALKAYMAKHKRPPAKLDDLGKEGFIPFVPFAPPGMRYELDAAHGEVKLVNPLVK